MAATFDQIAAGAMELTPEERGRLVDLLLEKDAHEDDDVPLSPEWRAEIERRIKEIDDGAETIDGDEFLAELREELRRGRE